MYVGVAIYELHISQAQSLKEKRSVLRRVRARIRNRFEIAVSEVALQGSHQRARIAVTAVSSDGRLIEKLLADVSRLIGEDVDAVLTGAATEILPFDENVRLDTDTRKFEP